ncbi:2-keto-4-methylthiobutyrate aminotransferase [Aerophototrophica crusticola]|uniref:Probable branched-chain-amino-acid aminotransferase n=1 Tax=Aerophototrophica crusticola TaxID=1709002 RepID=A0A858R8F4_9PROT|nr:2-keto-4-methylthiobutyrate aminotransferase [Rhodospirillaceae bacterium B3]
MSGPVLWLDGALVPAAEARIDPADRGLTLGDGLFETIRVEGGQGMRLDAHFARLGQGADLLGLPVPPGDDRLADAVAAVAGANGLADAAVRLTLTAGPGPRGLPRPTVPRPTLMLTAASLPPPQGPARLVVATVTCRNERSPLSRVKSLNYLDSILARNEATARGADDAVLLNTRGRVAEASAANLFALLDGVWVTPPVGEGALPGVMRAAMIREWAAVERALTVDELGRAEAIRLTTALGVREARVSRCRA